MNHYSSGSIYIYQRITGNIYADITCALLISEGESACPIYVWRSTTTIMSYNPYME